MARETGLQGIRVQLHWRWMISMCFRSTLLVYRGWTHMRVTTSGSRKGGAYLGVGESKKPKRPQFMGCFGRAFLAPNWGLNWDLNCIFGSFQGAGSGHGTQRQVCNRLLCHCASFCGSRIHLILAGLCLPPVQ